MKSAGSFITTNLLLLTVALSGCRKEPSSPPPLTSPVLPVEHFNYANPFRPDFILNDSQLMAADNSPSDNPVTDAGATLGRVLFYEKALSLNRSVSCASCHQQAHAFSDPEKLSRGFAGGHTGRHSMGLSHARYYQNGRFFWDERATTLEEQVLLPIQDDTEMGLTLQQALERISLLPYYPSLFEDAFGDPAINPDRMAKALAQFVRSMESYQSKFDAGRALVSSAATAFPNFTESENAGKLFFLSGSGGACGGCHGTSAQIAPGPRNNGLDSVTTDEGVGGQSGIAAQVALFKTPSLRNIAVRPPFMHDGRFGTLEEVIAHYAGGVQNHPNLSFPLRQPNGLVRRIDMDEEDVQNLIAFLHTLTDHEFLTDEKFSNPFPEN